MLRRYGLKTLNAVCMLFLSFFLTIFSFAEAYGGAEKPKMCEIQSILNNSYPRLCGDIKENSRIFTRTKPLTVQEKEFLFSFAKKTIEDEISKGRAFQSLNFAEQALWLRIHSTEIKNLTEEEASQTAKCQSKNNYPSPMYALDYHTIFVCPDFFSLSIPFILFSFGHELGHVIDRCTSGYALLRETSDNTGFLSLANKKEQVYHEIQHSFLSLPPDKGKCSKFIEAMKTFEKLSIDLFLAQKSKFWNGVTSGSSGLEYDNLYIEPIKYELYPFDDIYTCLSKKEIPSFNGLYSWQIQRASQQSENARREYFSDYLKSKKEKMIEQSINSLNYLLYPVETVFGNYLSPFFSPFIDLQRQWMNLCRGEDLDANVEYLSKPLKKWGKFESAFLIDMNWNAHWIRLTRLGSPLLTGLGSRL